MLSQNGTVAADLAALEGESYDTSVETEINDAEATEAVKQYERIQEDMLLSVKYKVCMKLFLPYCHHVELNHIFPVFTKF